jgi:hypothetical protein
MGKHLLLLAVAAAAGAVSTVPIASYDRALMLDAPGGWYSCPRQAFARDKAKPTFCLQKAGAQGPPPLLVVDIVLNQAYAPKVSLKEIAARDLAARREKVPDGEFTTLKPVKFREGMEGWGFGMKTGGTAFDLFYFGAGRKRYYATCLAVWEKECFAALRSLRVGPTAH